MPKLLIEILDDAAINPDRGLISPIEVQFNPTEFTLEKSAQIAEIAIPGIDSPILQFIRGQTQKLTLELFFDTTEFGMGAGARDVRKQTKAIYQLVKIQPETHAPPKVRVHWGGEVDFSQGLPFTAIVESVQQKFTLFNPDGVPLRATLTVTFREYKSLKDQLGKLNLKSADQTKSYVVTRSETLSQIAAKVYDDASRWREIAERNEDLIANPRRLVPGTVLRIPPLDTFDLKTVT